MYHFAGDVGQAEVATGVAIGQPGMVEAEQVQDGGVEVVDVDGAFDGAVAELVGGTVDVAAFHAAAGKPDREAPVVVVAAHAGLAIDQLDGRRATEFTAAEDERFLEEPALFQVGEESGDRLVALLAQRPVRRGDVVVAVPGLNVAVKELDEIGPRARSGGERSGAGGPGRRAHRGRE